ncbi:MAG: type II toxin-antitoxin system ParD family antitoxin [Xanthomonadales bacterium]|nr:type II toxin-antitoxin system ParD family antitoxin [Xanthomonadales bacterium]
MATMNISLPDELKQFIDSQVAEGGYTSSSEYLRELIRKQRDVESLRSLLLDGFNSAPTHVVDDSFVAEIRAIAEDRADP